MKEKQISYERTIYKSYMKIPSVEEASFDEHLIMMNKIDGTIACEKCYVNGTGQYWYDITGKQALDYFCKVNLVGSDFLTSLLLSICDVFERLEWNLIDEKCLQLDPGMIFVSHKNEEFVFILYPEEDKKNVFASLITLMEYLLTKIDHTEKAFVSWAYEIYEFILSEEYGIEDLKNKILQKRIENLVTEKEEKQDWEMIFNEEIIEEMESEEVEPEEDAIEKEWKEVVDKGIARLRELFFKHRENVKNEEFPIVVYPEDEEDEEQVTIHPTVCMSTIRGEARGVLIYEGLDGYPDFEMGKEGCVVGKSHRAKLKLERDTISQFHAKIEYEDSAYYIEDMNSTNGTSVNEDVLNYKEKRALQPGDIIQFADVRYRFW